ncbi:hypothetical protein UFOVP407_38 [uncultured Caudovirales phage]|uniref:Uncharacterized protein n=1 Tax=uncultured Caudovirales phage TaxID=2100421 RepID=A0A6J5M262_9CAUD|nr:hypothetical protein UFOVP407_38 [uncultured Caudovirales phage]
MTFRLPPLGATAGAGGNARSGFSFPHRSYSFDRDGRANGHDASVSGVNAARIGGAHVIAANYASVADSS